MRRALYRGALGLGLVVAVALPAHAQGANVLDGIISQFQGRATGWEAALQALALRTFGTLALIEMTWSAAKLAFRGADLSEWLAEIINQILTIGLFLALLQNASTWGTAIVESYRAAGVAAGATAVAPSSVFAAGVVLGQKVLGQMSIWSPASSVSLMVAAIVIEVCFALMAATMVITLVQSYIVISAGVLNMAFGGSRWTRDIAISTFRYALSVGAKLLMLQLLISIGQGIILDWAAQFSDLTNSSLLILIGAAVVMLALVKVLPDEFQRVVGGASLSSGSALTGAAMAVAGGAAGAVAGAVGAGSMATNALKLASAQMGAADSKAAGANGGEAPERSMISRAAGLTGATAKNLATAPIRDLGRRLSGAPGTSHGMATWRMGADMANQRRLLSDDNNKPPPPPSPPSSNNNSIS